MVWCPARHKLEQDANDSRAASVAFPNDATVRTYACDARTALEQHIRECTECREEDTDAATAGK
jgi:hypothetical protein